MSDISLTPTNIEHLVQLQACVKRGAALLDKKLPGWRKTMKKHVGVFHIEQSDHCVLGTLEHYHGKLQALKAPKSVMGERGYWVARARLGFTTLSDGVGKKKSDSFYGFNHWFVDGNPIPGEGFGACEVEQILNALWKEEFR